MGAVLAVPVEAEPWSVEVRSESSCLFTGNVSVGFPAVRRGADAVSLTLDRWLVTGLVVARDALLAHPYLAGLQQPVGWSAMGYRRGQVAVRGPGRVYFTEPDARVDRLARMIKVEHVWLAGLRAALEPWAGSPPPVVHSLG